MANAYETGALWSSNLPAGQRSYYEQMLLDVLRTNSILVPYAAVKEDFRARDTGVIIYTEVMDTEPNWNALSESGIWLSGAHLDSRSVQIQLEIHGDVIKISDYNELVNFWNNGDLRGLAQGKLGQNMTAYLDILARNAFLAHPNKNALINGTLTPGGARTSILSTDLFDPDIAETIRTHLEENEVPGVAAVTDGAGQTIVCATTPRVIHDIRVGAGSGWLDVQNYNQTGRKFNSEAGMWAGVRFVKSNRLRLRNYGAVTTQTTLNGATVVGQGAAATVDTVYSVGQSTSTRYITVDSATGFAVGQYITIHSVAIGSPGDPPITTDGTQEERRIVGINGLQISLDKPLMKPHADGDYVTNGRAIHSSIFMGGPGVVFGIGERPHPLVLPKIDDLAMVQRFSWRMFGKFQMFRPEFYEVVETAGSTD